MQETALSSPFVLQMDPKCGEEVSKILLVHNCDDSAPNESQEAVIEHFNALGYSVSTLQLSDKMVRIQNRAAFY